MKNITSQLAILGGGPGGYTAAFRAADLGIEVTLIEPHTNLGGVCLNVGCIPSKTLLHIANTLETTKELNHHGITFSTPNIDLNKLRTWKNSVIRRLATGLATLAKMRNINVVPGTGKFISAKQIEVTTKEETLSITFENIIIAAGSETIKLPFLPEDPRIMGATGALELDDIPGELLIIGGGVIGLEMASIYNALGSKISVVELTAQLIPGIDADLVKPLYDRINKKYNIMLETKVIKAEAKNDGIWVTFAGKNAIATPKRFDRVLVAVGRKPNSNLINTQAAGVVIDKKGFISVDANMRTNIANIFAIGDIVGNPLLAHKASAEGKIAAEVIAGKDHSKLVQHIPSIAYTDPEIATIGLTENEAREKNIPYKKALIPWQASGRALSMGRPEGFTKLLFDPKTEKILGGALVGANAGELIAEIALALTLEANASQIADTIHPHPTLSETIMLSAELFLGTVTDFYLPKK